MKAAFRTLRLAWKVLAGGAPSVRHLHGLSLSADLTLPLELYATASWREREIGQDPITLCLWTQVAFIQAFISSNTLANY